MSSHNKIKNHHNLKNLGKARDIINKANLKSTDIILEINPGIGNLTIIMLPLVKKIIAIEFNLKIIAALKKRVNNSKHVWKLKIIFNDVLKIKLPFFNVCVSNTPYKISSPLTFKLLTHKPFFRCAILIFQNEFAQRVVAKPGSNMWCRLSVNCQLLARCDYLMKINKCDFSPVPQIDSAVIRLKPRHPPLSINYLEWDGMIRTLFNRKNKTLRSLLLTKTVLKMFKDNYITFCSLNSKIPYIDVKKEIELIINQNRLSKIRPSKMDVDQLIMFLKQFNEKGFHFRT